MMQMLNVSALISKYKTVGDHTEFVIQITCNGGIFLIYRRFSDFDQLHSRLTRQYGDLIEARLPEKQWFGRFDPNFLMKRQASLQEYLDKLLEVPGILEDPSLLHFLNLEKHLELANDLNKDTSGNGRSSLALLSKSGILNEHDRLSAIVENAAQAFIDISEVPEPLEAEQAVQRKNEILNASQGLLNEQKLGEQFMSCLTVLALPATSRLSSEIILARVESGSKNGLAYQQERDFLWSTLEKVEESLRLDIAPPSSDLLAIMDGSMSSSNPTLSNGGGSALLDGSVDEPVNSNSSNGLGSSYN